MEHSIRAIIGTHKDVQRLEKDWIDIKEIELPQGYGMIFLTDDFLDDMIELFESVNGPSDVETVTNYLLQEYSFHTKLAYIEIDYFGGVGIQSGTLYENGRISIAPRGGEGTINVLLKSLGVWCKANKDEFDSLNLGIYRRMDKWIKESKRRQ